MASKMQSALEKNGEQSEKDWDWNENVIGI